MLATILRFLDRFYAHPCRDECERLAIGQMLHERLQWQCDRRFLLGDKWLEQLRIDAMARQACREERE